MFSEFIITRRPPPPFSVPKQMARIQWCSDCYLGVCCCSICYQITLNAHHPTTCKQVCLRCHWAVLVKSGTTTRLVSRRRRGGFTAEREPDVSNMVMSPEKTGWVWHGFNLCNWFLGVCLDRLLIF